MKIIHVVTSEKAVAGIEKENKLTFVIEENATKAEVKKEIEKEYGERVKGVTTQHTPHGRKKAIVSFVKKGAASELAAKLKVI